MRDLILIGYWKSDDAPGWPDPRALVDHEWDSEDRDAIAQYLETGLVSRAYMGFSPCRVCGADNGNLELTDLTYVWPSGLAHYVRDHGVRLPAEFVDHVTTTQEAVEKSGRDESWWRAHGTE
jgi:hypothetical protein